MPVTRSPLARRTAIPDATIEHVIHVVEEWMNTNGVTQEELAAKIGVPQPTLNRWLNGRRKPGREGLDRLLGVCDNSTLCFKVELCDRKTGKTRQSWLADAEPPAAVLCLALLGFMATEMVAMSLFPGEIKFALAQPIMCKM